MVENCIQNKPEFSWWVSKVLRHRSIIISKLNPKYWRTIHKFKIQLTKNVEEALRIDKAAGNDYREKELNKEMNKVNVACQQVDRVTTDQSR